MALSGLNYLRGVGQFLPSAVYPAFPILEQPVFEFEANG